MAINQELKKAIDTIKFSFKLKQSEVAKQLGVKSTYLSDMINGRVPFSDSMREKIYEVYSYNFDEDENLGLPTSSAITVPLLPISAQGGLLNDFVTSINKDECEQIISPVKGADFAITVAGDSMAPEYPSGTQIFIKRINEKAFIDWGKVYVLDTCNGSVIKRVFPSDNGDEDRVKCVSINREYPPFDVSLKDVFGVYRVILSMSIK